MSKKERETRWIVSLFLRCKFYSGARSPLHLLIFHERREEVRFRLTAAFFVSPVHPVGRGDSGGTGGLSFASVGAGRLPLANHAPGRRAASAVMAFPQKCPRLMLRWTHKKSSPLFRRIRKPSKKGHDSRRDLFWSCWPDLNRRPADYESAALPTEPQQHMKFGTRAKLKCRNYFTIKFPSRQCRFCGMRHWRPGNRRIFFSLRPACSGSGPRACSRAASAGSTSPNRRGSPARWG